MRILSGAILALTVTAVSVQADEIEDILQGALDAYQSGDAKLAKEEVEYVLELLKEVEGNAMTSLLPKPLEGWEMELTDDAAAMSMLGGAGVSAEYMHNDSGDSFSVQILTSPQIVGSIGMMLGNTAALASMGDVMRIKRQKFVISDDQIQGLVDKRVYVNFEGRNVDAMRAHLETLDIDAIKDF